MVLVEVVMKHATIKVAEAKLEREHNYGIDYHPDVLQCR